MNFQNSLFKKWDFVFDSVDMLSAYWVGDMSQYKLKQYIFSLTHAYLGYMKILSSTKIASCVIVDVYAV